MFFFFVFPRKLQTDQSALEFLFVLIVTENLTKKMLLYFYSPNHFDYFFSSYKVVIGLVDPVGNTVELHDLKPYTYYQLDLRERHGQSLYASVNFSTAGNL